MTRALRLVRLVALAPVAGRTWREVGYCVTGVVQAIPTFLLAAVGAVAGAYSVVTVGLPVLVGVLLLARGTVRYFRPAARLFVGWTWPNPPPLPYRGESALVRAGVVLRDGTGWRALLYCFLRLPLTALGAYLGGILVAEGVLGVSNLAWRPFGLYLEIINPWVTAVLALGELLLFPWYFRLIVWLDRALVRALLEPSPARDRIAELEASRAALRADSAALLRRVERDLHDGTQARLVALGVALSRIRHRVGDPAVRAMVTDAQHAVVESLAELREIVRGIHPPALDAGLPTALETLAARSAVPVELHVAVRGRAAADIESALYFSAAELLTNIARHADATRVRLDLCADGETLRLVVGDNGHGGARTDGPGTGLAGLARRVAALDGSLIVHSPPGGPTRVEVRLPNDTLSED